MSPNLESRLVMEAHASALALDFLNFDFETVNCEEVHAMPALEFGIWNRGL